MIDFGLLSLVGILVVGGLAVGFGALWIGRHP